jgi:hypothetical protein
MVPAAAVDSPGRSDPDGSREQGLAAMTLAET